MPKSETGPWPAKRRRNDEEYKQKREAVIRVAARLIHEKGYESATLGEIAEQLNVTKPTLYYYVASKAQILEECRARLRDGVQGAISEANASKGTGLEKLELFILRYVEAISTDYGKALIASFRSSARVEDLADFRQSVREYDRVLRSFIEDGIKDGSVRPCNARLTVFAIFGALNWVANWHKPGGPADAKAIAEEFSRLFSEGLAPRG